MFFVATSPITANTPKRRCAPHQRFVRGILSGLEEANPSITFSEPSHVTIRDASRGCHVEEKEASGLQGFVDLAKDFFEPAVRVEEIVEDFAKRSHTRNSRQCDVENRGLDERCCRGGALGESNHLAGLIDTPYAVARAHQRACPNSAAAPKVRDQSAAGRPLTQQREQSTRACGGRSGKSEVVNCGQVSSVGHQKEDRRVCLPHKTRDFRYDSETVTD
jgi:hypothetical protein